MKKRGYGYQAYLNLAGTLENLSAIFEICWDEEELLRASRTLISLVKKYLPETENSEEFMEFQQTFEKYKTSLNSFSRIFSWKLKRMREELCEYGEAVAEMASVEWDSIASPRREYEKRRITRNPLEEYEQLIFKLEDLEACSGEDLEEVYRKFKQIMKIFPSKLRKTEAFEILVKRYRELNEMDKEIGILSMDT